MGNSVGRLSLSHHPTDARLLVTIQGNVGTKTEAILGRLRRMFDLDIDLASVHVVLGRSPSWPAPGRFPGRPSLGAWSPFELLVRTIVGQQVSVKAATTIMGRIASRLGKPVELLYQGGPSFLFPTPRHSPTATSKRLACRRSEFSPCRASPSDRRCDAPIPESAADGTVVELKEALLKMPGIGPWTVEYFALRARDANAWARDRPRAPPRPRAARTAKPRHQRRPVATLPRLCRGAPLEQGVSRSIGKFNT